MATQVSQLPTQNANLNNKRKRGPGDQDGGRLAKALNTNGDHEASYAALLQGIDAPNLQEADDNTRTAQAALAAPMGQSTYPEPGSFDGTSDLPSGFEDGSPSANFASSGPQALMDARTTAANQSNKPSVGTAEWHQQRKDNHKEVERRRREVINEGIENIAKVVPGTEKNKGAILQRTCQYISELQTKVGAFDNERATFEIALKELTTRLDRMKESSRTAWAESAKWQQRARDAGLHFDDYDEGALTGLEDEDVNLTGDS